MNYDFDYVINRRHTDSTKWNVKDNELPMWIADMDFLPPKEITDEFHKKIDEEVLGYTTVTEEWYKRYQNWWMHRYNHKIEKEWLLYCSGIVPGITSILRVLGKPEDRVILLTPVYNAFFYAIEKSGRKVIECPMDYEKNQYSINFERLEEVMKEESNKFLILCNPHNPSGNIWSKEELLKISELVDQYNMILISDEIHCDITEPGYSYIPYASISEKARNHSITCIAPTKAFNLAGTKSSAIYIPKEEYRKKIEAQFINDWIASPNSFGVLATCAFEKGEKWLNQMCAYVFENRKYAEEYIEKNIPILSTVKSHATYLLWIDISKTNLDSETFYTKLRETTGLYITAGKNYGEAGNHHMRFNLACPRVTLEDGLNRLKEFWETL